MRQIAHEECVRAWAAKLTIGDICEVERTKDGTRKVKFNHSKAAEACTSKLPIRYCYERCGRYGLVFWDGEKYSYATKTILRNVFDILAGSAATKSGAEATFELICAKLLVMPGLDMGSGNAQFTLYKRARTVA